MAVAPSRIDDDAWARRTSAAIAAGSREALASLYERRFDFLYSSVRERTACDEAFALDCVQDAMFKVANSIRPLHDSAALDRWLRRVVLNAALDRLRSESQRRARERQVARKMPSATDGAYAARRIEAELADLDSESRSLLDLRFGRGLTLNQLAAATGLSPKAVDSRIRRLVSRIRGAFGTAGLPRPPERESP